MLKSEKRIRQAVLGEIEYEELTMKELKQLERMIFKAVVEKFKNNVAPSTQTRH